MRAMSLPEMALMARQRVDIGGQNTAFGGNAGDNVTDQEITSYFNLAIPKLWTLLTATLPDNYGQAPQPYYFPITSGVSVYPLPADFKSLLGCDVALDNTGNNWTSLRPYNWHERNKYAYLQASTFTYVPWSNIQYQVQGNNPANLAFIPNIGPLPGNIRVTYITAAPYLCQSLPTAYAVSTSYALGALVYVSITPTNGNATNQVFMALNAGSSAGTAPSWLVPGVTTDNNIQWAYKGPLSLFATEFDGISGWEDYAIIDVAIRIGIKQEFDVSLLIGEQQQAMQRIMAEAKDRTAVDPQCIMPGWGSGEGSGGSWGGSGFGGGMGW
jgi:hypothetical protein